MMHQWRNLMHRAMKIFWIFESFPFYRLLNCSLLTGTCMLFFFLHLFFLNHQKVSEAKNLERLKKLKIGCKFVSCNHLKNLIQSVQPEQIDWKSDEHCIIWLYLYTQYRKIKKKKKKDWFRRVFTSCCLLWRHIDVRIFFSIDRW